jgi:glucosamine--fructose-6-phosphate aminotransferase (isomerizing)
LTSAGPEVGVASTKAFTTQLAVMLLLATYLGRAHGSIDRAMESELVRALRDLPEALSTLGDCERDMATLAEEWHRSKSALYLGRGPLYPIALEGALKLKEISYIHAEGYPAGEMKHGPIALIDAKMPVFALVPSDDHRDRMLSNLQEAASRDGKIIGFVKRGDSAIRSIAHSVIELPDVDRHLAPILYSLPLQLFAYHVAVQRGCNVDRPRNLAKSVTVE